MSKNSIGSFWNKWDLHIHTPASFEWKDGKKFSEMDEVEKKISIEKIINKINSLDVVAFAIMDYFTFEGILEIRKYLKKNEFALEKTIFPGIELRIDAPVNYRLNIHAVFDEKITDQELNDFKSSLIISGNVNKRISRDSIILAARSLAQDKADEHGHSDYKQNDNSAFILGCKTIKITKESFESAIGNLSKEKCLVILPYDCSDGVSKLDWKKHPHDATYFLNLADIFESRNQDNINLFLNIITDKNKDFIGNFFSTMGGKAKPVISGSDAHKIEDYSNFPSGKITWIKAEPNFRGLRKTLIEARGRTFIGDEPEKLKLVKYKPTKFISKVEIKKLPEANLDEVWFNNIININSELIAIIGNKGSGKSALADILGLLGNSRKEKSFSFLNEKKFRERQMNKSRNYTATIGWLSGDSQTKFLSEGLETASVETIKYIPQSHLEDLCNEIESENIFDQELKSVIFSHICESEKLGHETLDNLIKYKTEEKKKEITHLRNELEKILIEILEDETKLTEEYSQNIANKLKIKKNELDAHSKIKPLEIAKPEPMPSNKSNSSENLKKLEILNKDETDLKSLLDKNKKALDLSNKKKAYVEKVIQKINLIEKQYDNEYSLIEPALEKMNLIPGNILSLKINKEPIEKLINEINNEIKEINLNLNFENKDGLIFKINQIQVERKRILEDIDEPNKKYQAYISQLETWNKTLNSIQGNQSQPDTIEYFNAQIDEIKNIPAKLKKLEEKRDQIVQKIFDSLSDLVKCYEQFYKPVQDFINMNPFADDTFKMSFDVSISDIGFSNLFFSQLNRNRIGTFYGKEESENYLDNILFKYNFNQGNDVKNFTREIIYSLKYDLRDNKNVQNSPISQIKDGKVLELYKFIFGLEYLEPKYSIKLNGKKLELLSPGERGTLLLIFYLMVDKDDRPLVIDQPEENLDNQTIYKVLVPCIKSAKQHRQLFLITHNPNLAVVCDAEQVIVASINKADKNKVQYQSGAIESVEINQLIIDILEGTRPAFDNRKSKYFSEATDDYPLVA